MWCNETEENSEFRYMMGGEVSFSQSIGLLEIVKDMVMNE